MSLRGPLAVAAVSMLALGACPGKTSPYDDDPWPDADADVDGDVDGDGDADGDGDVDVDGDDDADAPPVEGGPGPITLVTRTAILTVERVCDLDGDGLPDNAIADLGSPAAEMTAATLSSALGGEIEEDRRILLHFPLVEDRGPPTDPETVCLIFNGIDEDDPPDPSDDFATVEGFWANPGDLDGCGEPKYSFTPVALAEGVIDGTSGMIFLPVTDEIPIHAGDLLGTIDPGGAAARVQICAYATIRELGEARGLDEAGGDLSMLEIFLAGGEPLGLPIIPGLNPDVDVDRDGLEQVLLDADFHVVACVDGDRTTIVTDPECWRDERFADAFSLTLELTGQPARFLGRPDGWEGLVDGTCDGGPPDTSLFDPR